MDPTAIFALATELVKAFNMAQANKPAEQVRAEALIAWGIAKPVLNIFLPGDIKKQLEQAGIKL